jgi:hypothetical protein
MIRNSLPVATITDAPSLVRPTRPLMDRPKDSSLSCSYDIFKGPVKKIRAAIQFKQTENPNQSHFNQFLCGLAKKCKNMYFARKYPSMVYLNYYLY